MRRFAKSREDALKMVAEITKGAGHNYEVIDDPDCYDATDGWTDYDFSPILGGCTCVIGARFITVTICTETHIILYP